MSVLCTASCTGGGLSRPPAPKTRPWLASRGLVRVARSPLVAYVGNRGDVMAATDALRTVFREARA